MATVFPFSAGLGSNSFLNLMETGLGSYRLMGSPGAPCPLCSRHGAKDKWNLALPLRTQHWGTQKQAFAWCHGSASCTGWGSVEGTALGDGTTVNLTIFELWLCSK